MASPGDADDRVAAGTGDPIAPGRRIGRGDVLAIALPITLSNATVPLIGFVDTAVVGQLGAAHLMGAVAVGSVVFTMLYWSFSFLRMGTTGLTAQALGAGNTREVAGHILRALLVAVLAGAALIALRAPLRTGAFWLTGGTPAVLAAAATYFDIRIWAAPAGLVNFALLGWLIGLGRAGTAFMLQLGLNVLNIALAVLLGIHFAGGVAGVATAALLAEYAAALVGLLVALRLGGRLAVHAPLVDAIDWRKMRRSLAINGDLIVRSFTGYAAIVVFTSTGAKAGDVTLAANALLYSMMAIAIYLIDGFAFAAEALVGRAIGARDKPAFLDAVRISTQWAAVFACGVGAVIWLTGPAIIAMSARNAEVQAAAHGYLGWVALAPICGVWCFQLDGIFTGATRTRDMRNMMLVSIAVYLAAVGALAGTIGNHGLWAAYMVLFLVRALTLAGRYPALLRSAFPRTANSTD